MRVEACKELFAKTSNPSQEERLRIAQTYRAEESTIRDWFKVQRKKKQRSEEGANRSVLEEPARARLLKFYKENKNLGDD